MPLSNPQTVPAVLRLAAAIARDRNYELECLQVMLVPRSSSPSEATVRTAKSRRLLQRAERIVRPWDLPVHTQVRVAHDVAQAILETIKERHIDVILMGWEGEISQQGRIFGNVVDTVIRQAACEVVLVKWGDKLLSQVQKDPEFPACLLPPEPTVECPIVNGSCPIPAAEFPMQELGLHELMALHRWLVPIRGSYQQAAALRILPALVAISAKPEIKLCQVHQPSMPEPDEDELERSAQLLHRRIRCPVIATQVCAKSVPDALIDLAQKDQCDVIVLGASREGLLKQVIKGNIPEAVARGCDCTVILVRTVT